MGFNTFDWRYYARLGKHSHLAQRMQPALPTPPTRAAYEARHR